MPNNHLDISLVPLLLEIVLPRKEGRILFLMNMLQNKKTLPRGTCTLPFHLQTGSPIKLRIWQTGQLEIIRLETLRLQTDDLVTDTSGHFAKVSQDIPGNYQHKDSNLLNFISGCIEIR